MFYPLFFEPVYKNIIWGGRNFERVFGRSLPEGKVAESWDICCHKNGMSIVANGELRGKTLEELISEYRGLIVGTKSENMDRFPILIKLIDANDKLSIQVHPGNEYALKSHGDLGKTEMWYIIDAKPNAKLIYGTKPGTSKDEFEKSIFDNTVETKLNYVDVKKGDVIFIPSGTLHAIMEGLLIAEIQQNSDTTYRVYDFNRMDAAGNKRELHISSALDVINFDFEGSINKIEAKQEKDSLVSNIVDCEYFKVDKIEVTSEYYDETKKESFTAFTCVEGNGFIIHENKDYKIKNGASFMLPASLGGYTIKGKLTLLKSYI